VHAGPHHVLHAGSEGGQRSLDVAEHLDGLRVSIAAPDDLPALVGCRRAGHLNDVTDAHGARVAHDGLPARAGGIAFPLHGTCSSGWMRGADSKCVSRADATSPLTRRRDSTTPETQGRSYVFGPSPSRAKRFGGRGD